MVITWDKYRDMLMKKASVEKIPFWGAFELTPRCNFQCKMCYVCRPLSDKDAISRELTTEQWVSMAEQARDAGVLYLTLTGGEVLARYDFETIYREISQMGFNVTILTNGSLINQHIADLFSQYMPSKVSITLYGASEETYKKVTGVSSGFKRTLHGIDLLAEKGVNLEVKTTVVNGNASEFDQIEQLVSSRGARFAVVNYISPRREGDFSDPVGNRLTPKELAQYEMHLNQLNRSKSGEIIAINKGEILDDSEYLSKKILSQAEINNENCAFDCFVGKCAFWVTWDGRLTPCGMLDKPEAFPLSDGFVNAWEYMNNEVNKIPVCTDCRNCNNKEYCNPCPARRFSETGSYDKKAPYLCECTQERMKLVRQKKY